jgi:hypothetical protein
VRLVDACRIRGQGEVLVARDRSGKTVAAHFFAWNSESAWSLLSGTEDSARQSGAPSLLMSAGIELAAGHSERFDFEGSRVPSINGFFANFGGRSAAYSTVTHAGSGLGRVLEVVYQSRLNQVGRTRSTRPRLRRTRQSSRAAN